MIKRTKSISINILSVFIILICVFMGVVGKTNSWFTAKHQDGVQIEVVIGNLLLKIYQITGTNGENSREIYSDQKNAELKTDTQYVELSGEIKPDTDITLNLKLANEDQGATSMYVKFKFEVFKRGTLSDENLYATIKGFDAPTQNTKGFVKNGDYYYYQNTSGNVQMEKNETAIMMQSFSIPYSSFLDDNGDIANGSDTIYIKLTVDTSISNWTV